MLALCPSSVELKLMNTMYNADEYVMSQSVFSGIKALLNINFKETDSESQSVFSGIRARA